MPATFINNSPVPGKVTVRLEASANTAKMAEIINNVAEWRHSNGDGPIDGNGAQIPFANLSNQQKLNIYFGYIRRKTFDWARAWADDVAKKAIIIVPSDYEFDEE